ncbi:MAG: GyrI-like domain-containing protein [Anaerolineales bacterium]|nr:GyrI-like domain-containing protein [Anaerolineales bacterium]
MIDTPNILTTPGQRTAVIRITVPRAEIQVVMGPGYQELMETLKAQGIQPTGPWFTHHLRMNPDVFDFELGAPVDASVSPAGRVTPGSLPATRVAHTTYRGPYEGLGEAWGAFQTWMAAQALTTADDLWEVYTAGPETGPDPATWRTDLYQPLTS